MNNPFVGFFGDVFSRNLSGALFAIESSFSGTIESVSRTTDKSVRVRDGMATFFVCIAGDSDAVYTYCAALAEELTSKKLKFNSSVFIVANNERPGLDHSECKDEFEHKNLVKETVDANGKEAYMLRSSESRWSAAFALKNINPASFAYRCDFSVSYSDGKGGRPGEATKFEKVQDLVNISTKLVPSKSNGNLPLHLVMETKNNGLKKGWYKIDYSIVPDAVPVPPWVSALDAPNIASLEQSAEGKNAQVKVLDFEYVYKKIAEEYNKAKQRSIYQDELYFVKR